MSHRDIDADWGQILPIIAAAIGSRIGGVAGAVIGGLIGGGFVWWYKKYCTRDHGAVFTATVRAHKVWRLSYPDKWGSVFHCAR
ncbi:hypothetical protein L3i22_059900 [Actinoplanes sp. L3-i22]|nr:hypothetical protein L3i22_059900 [Actinoplanes sp. L3-i22]